MSTERPTFPDGPITDPLFRVSDYELTALARNLIPAPGRVVYVDDEEARQARIESDRRRRRRIGRVRLWDSMVEDLELDALYEIMRDLIVLKMDYRPDLGVTDYFAISDHFEELPDGFEAPIYQPTILRAYGDTGEIEKVTWST